jgi:hypothetical protein
MLVAFSTARVSRWLLRQTFRALKSLTSVIAHLGLSACESLLLADRLTG